MGVLSIHKLLLFKTHWVFLGGTLVVSSWSDRNLGVGECPIEPGAVSQPFGVLWSASNMILLRSRDLSSL